MNRQNSRVTYHRHCCVTYSHHCHHSTTCCHCGDVPSSLRRVPPPPPPPPPPQYSSSEWSAQLAMPSHSWLMKIHVPSRQVCLSPAQPDDTATKHGRDATTNSTAPRETRPRRHDKLYCTTRNTAKTPLQTLLHHAKHGQDATTNSVKQELAEKMCLTQYKYYKHNINR